MREIYEVDSRRRRNRLADALAENSRRKKNILQRMQLKKMLYEFLFLKIPAQTKESRNVFP